jgi:uncharacterized protein (DUF885 family)
LKKTSFRKTLAGTSLVCLLQLGSTTGLLAEPQSSLNRSLDQAYDEISGRSPTELTRQGSNRRKGEWDNLGLNEAKDRCEVYQRWAKVIGDMAIEGLDTEERLSRRLFLEQAEEEKRSLEFAEYDYPVNQMYGLHSDIPAFLANAHKVSSLQDAQAYVDRIERLPALFDQLAQGLLRRETMGVMPPTFVYDYVISDIDNLLQGYPLGRSTQKASATAFNPVYQDFSEKLDKLGLQAKDEGPLRKRAVTAMIEGYQLAYQKLRKLLVEQKARSTQDDGVWKFPNGARFYAQQLAKVTTTDLNADQIHQIGLDEVTRVQSEMLAVLKRIQFKGSLPDFFEFCRTNPKLLYSNDAAGRAAYMKDANAIVDNMRTQLDRLFLTKPKAALVVRAVEAYREKSAGKAFYESGSPDFSRPGIYYANLYDMTAMPKYQMEALAYHEAIPGHHMQLSIAQELTGIPKFRQNAGYTAYVEGWGLYCERLPKEHGFYRDPYSDFGRLTLELFRCVRLVVDTGIHHKRWTRAQALDYYLKNTPNSRSDCQKMVDRHIVMPGQATAYKIGMMEILRLRAKAQAELGQRFDLREFHDVVLVHGAVPLKVLEELVDGYIQQKR